MTIHGYNPHGPRTLGAEYAREHPEDLPDGVEVGKKIELAGRRLVIGKPYRLAGHEARVLKQVGVGLVVDFRGADAAWLDRNMPEGHIFPWNGLYWRVNSVNGVFVALAPHGPGKRQPGWVNFTRRGLEMVRPSRGGH